MRSAIVFTPRSVSQQSKGASAVPSAFWWKYSSLPTASLRTASSPAIRSEWPATNLVALVMLMSAPSASGD